MITESDITFNCPSCGQGGLELVQIKSPNSPVAAVCSECDRIWPTPQKVGLHYDAWVEDTLRGMGLKGDWNDFILIQKGVPVTMLDEEYRAFVMQNVTS